MTNYANTVLLALEKMFLAFAPLFEPDNRLTVSLFQFHLLLLSKSPSGAGFGPDSQTAFHSCLYTWQKGYLQTMFSIYIL